MNAHKNLLAIDKIINTSLLCIAIFALPLNIIIYFALNESEYLFPRLIPPFLGLIGIIAAFFRNKINFTLKSWGLIIFLFIVGCFNLILGLIDTASLWFVLSIIHTLFVAKKNEALIIFFISFLTIFFIGILMMLKNSFIPLNYHFKNCQFACVAVRIIHFLLIGCLIYYILHIFISTIKKNIKDLEEKNIRLNQLNMQLHKEMTEKKEVQQQLIDSVILTEEKERQRIATDLHDGLGPVLSAINLYFDAFLDANENEKKEIGQKLKKNN